VPPLKNGRRHADAAGEERAEATEAGESDRHAHLRDGLIRQNQQVLGPLNLGVRTIPMGRCAEDRPEKADEVVRRNASASRDLMDRHSRFNVIAQPIAGETETLQKFVVQHAREVSGGLYRHRYRRNVASFVCYGLIGWRWMREFIA
jgi:hypothetical protein